MTDASAELSILVKAKDEASQVLTGMRGKLDSFSKSIGDISKTAAGVGLGVGITKASGFLQDAAKAAMDDAASVARLKQAVDNTGASYDDYSSQIDAVIKKGQDLAFTDDDTRSALALLTAQTGSISEATKRYALAQDLARGANIDVVTASKLLGKVTDENANVLGRYGIKVEKGTSETELFGLIQQKFGGQAKAFGDSQAGAMARISDSVHELQESIGYALLPVMQKATDLILTELIPAAQKVVGFLQDNKLAAGALAGAFAALVLVIAPIPIAIAGVVAAGVLLINHWAEVKAKAQEIWGSLPGPVRAALDFIRDYVQTRIEGIIQIFKGMKEIITGVIDLVSDLFHGRWKDAWDDLKKIASGVVDLLIGYVKEQFGNLPKILLDLVGQAASAGLSLGKAMANGIIDGINSFLNALSGKELIPGLNLGPLGSTPSVHLPNLGTIPRLAQGLPYVPYDNYLAMLHKGERVVPASENRAGAGQTVHFNGPITIQASTQAEANQSIDYILRALRSQGQTVAA